MEAIRKATSCRVIELLDAFVANNTIEALIGILDSISAKRFQEIEDKDPSDRTAEEYDLREIQINCICIFIQLSYRAQNIKKLEKLGAMKYILLSN
jgi:hypothetical protein